MSDPHLTPGDPLGGGRPPDRHPSEPATPSERPAAYASGPRPPGAGGPGLYDSPSPVTGSTTMPQFGGQLELAGWWSRVGAAVIDAMIIGFLALLLLVPLGIGAFGTESEGGIVALVVGVVLVVLVMAVVALVYAPLMMVKTNGQTVGRMATGIRVVRTSGQPMDFSTAALREIVLKWLLIGSIANSFTLGLASLLDVLWPLWDEERRALHDIPVNTRTVRA